MALVSTVPMYRVSLSSQKRIINLPIMWSSPNSAYVLRSLQNKSIHFYYLISMRFRTTGCAECYLYICLWYSKLRWNSIARWNILFKWSEIINSIITIYSNDHQFPTMVETVSSVWGWRRSKSWTWRCGIPEDHHLDWFV